jgi:hypothetical protein
MSDKIAKLPSIANSIITNQGVTPFAPPEQYDWYAPGVGFIRQIIKETREMIINKSGYLRGGSEEITVQLESFKK